jgi:hypothetical protein
MRYRSCGSPPCLAGSADALLQAMRTCSTVGMNCGRVIVLALAEGSGDQAAPAVGGQVNLGAQLDAERPRGSRAPPRDRVHRWIGADRPFTPSASRPAPKLAQSLFPRSLPMTSSDASKRPSLSPCTHQAGLAQDSRLVACLRLAHQLPFRIPQLGERLRLPPEPAVVRRRAQPPTC